MPEVINVSERFQVFQVQLGFVCALLLVERDDLGYGVCSCNGDVDLIYLTYLPVNPVRCLPALPARPFPFLSISRVLLRGWPCRSKSIFRHHLPRHSICVDGLASSTNGRTHRELRGALCP